MKYLLVLAVVVVAIWLWRKGRRESMRQRTPPPATPNGIAPPQAMVRCAHCGLHLPASEAVRGDDGTAYCSAAHRQAAAVVRRDR